MFVNFLSASAIVIIVSKVFVNGQEVVLVGKNKCVTNGSSGIVFNAPFDWAHENIKVSEFFPPLTSSNINCNFLSANGCPSGAWNAGNWIKINSLDAQIEDIVTDRRWEAFKIFTNVDHSLDNITPYERSISDGNDYRISFSARIKETGHVFLCTGNKIKASECFWVLLASDRTEIRRCGLNRISTLDRPCINDPVKDVVKAQPGVIDERFWVHFKIEKTNTRLTVMHGGRPHLTYAINNFSNIKPNHIFFYSKAAFWKIHSYEFLYTNGTFNAQLGPDIQPENGQVCLFLLLAMCSNCRLKIIIKRRRKTSKNELWNEEYESKDGRWREVNIRLKDVGNEELKMRVETKGGGKNSKRFWAMDDIRICSDTNITQYRFLNAEAENYLCQKITLNDVTYVSLDRNVSGPAVNCNSNEIGTSCIPCKLFTFENSCYGFKYCENANDETLCRCSAGFQGENCQEGCNNYYYGHSCTSMCRHCIDVCDKVVGSCNHCQNPFKGTFCAKAPIPMFIYPPRLISSTPNTCTVVLESFEIEGSEYNPLLEYRIHFRKMNTSSSWSNTYSYVFGDSERVIRNLEPDTVYEIRAVVDDHTGDFVPKIQCRTTCEHIKPEDVIVSPTDVSVKIQIKYNATYNCQLSKYLYLIHNSTGAVIDSNDLITKFAVSSLRPYQDYSIKLCYRKDLYQTTCDKWIVKNFTTEEGVPGFVSDILPNVSGQNISLTWGAPEPANGEIRHYNIEYLLMRRNSCITNIKESEPKTEISKTKHHVLYNLEAYSEYKLGINAETKKGAGPFVYAFLITEESVDIAQSELIKITGYRRNSTFITLKIREIYCEEYKGPIYYRLSVNCEQKWCKDVLPSPIEQYFAPTNGEYINAPSPLLPFVNYTFTLNVSRNRIDWILSDTKIFDTNSSVTVNKVKIEVTTAGESIGLRWKPPFPPTGELDIYKIDYWTSDHYLESVFTNGTHCLWPGYHCAKIHGLTYSHRYHIQLFARNKGHETYSLLDQTSPFAISAVSDAPENISFSWTNHNSLVLSWNHPNNTRGILKGFTIKIDSKNFAVTIPSEDDYQFEYKLEINSQNLSSINWCSSIKLSIYSVNKFGTNGFDSWLWAPPSSITDLTVETLSTTNTTIRIRINWSSPSMVKTLFLYVKNASDTNAPEAEEIIRMRQHEEGLLCQFHDVFGNMEYDLKKNCNASLELQRNYSITVVLVNECNQGAKGLRRIESLVTFACTKDVQRQKEEQKGHGEYAALLLLLLPVALFGYWYMKKRNLSSDDQIKPDKIPLANVINKPKLCPKQQPPIAMYRLKTQHSKRTKISDLDAYVRNAIENGELQRQHEMFPKGLVRPCEYGSLPENKTKNRYKNLIAYDKTRVILEKVPGDEYSDYINANYVDGYNVEKVYIATQGPKQSTLKDFWKMIWQKNVENIVMVANVIENGKKKVEQYWPDINQEKKYGDITVRFVSGNVFANFELRKFEVCLRNETRKLSQLHFISWPDHGVPLYSQSLVDFLQRMLKIPYNKDSPILVHCSAGVGRTGTIILSDICLRMAAGEGYVDFLAHLEHLREQRANLVDNVEQYKLVHLVVLECLFGMMTAIKCDENMAKTIENVLKSNKLQAEMKHLDNTTWQDRAMESIMDVTEIPTVCHEKNRFNDIEPGKYRLFLTCYPSHDETSSYINAVQVDGFQNPARYIVTQQPLPNTLGDFWRMVVERQCTVIISLNDINPHDKTVSQFWPEDGYELSPVDFLNISHVKEQEKQYYKIVTVQVQLKIRGVHDFTVDIIHFHNWKARVLLPNSIEEFLSFKEEATALSRKSQPTIVTCYDGVTACGVYVSMTFIIEKMKLEQECDVCLAVRSVRHNRKQFINTKVQYEFLYRAAVAYLGGFQPYSNFG